MLKKISTVIASLGMVLFLASPVAAAKQPSDTYRYRDNGARITLTYTCEDIQDRQIEPNPVAMIVYSGNTAGLTIYAHSPEVLDQTLQIYGFSLTPDGYAFLYDLLARKSCPVV